MPMRVLLVEDSKTDQILIGKMLNSVEIEFDCADTLSDGLEQLGEHRYDTVLLDVNLPDATGTSGLTQLRRLFPSVPVVVMTGEDSDAVGLEAIQEGAQDYLTKDNINATQLARSLAYSVERQQLEPKIVGIAERQYHFSGLLHNDGTLIHVNREALRSIGITASECLELPFWETIFWSHSAVLQERLKQAVQTALEGKQDSFLTTHALANGDFVEVEFTLSPFRSPKGEIIYLVADGTDVTERIRVERKLEETRREARRSKFFVDNSSEAIFWLCKDSQFDYVNKAACNMLGYSEQELLSLSAADVDVGFPLDIWQEFWVQLKTEGHRQFETEHICKDGSTLNVLATYYFHNFEEEEFIVGVTRDISKLKQANFELERFAHAAAHDLRTPLRGISSIATMIHNNEGNNLSDKTQRHLQKLKNRVNRMESLIEDLYVYSQSGKTVGPMKFVDVNELVEQTIDLVEPPKNLNVSIAPRLPAFDTYPALLQQVFLNLIGNAIKYHDKTQGQIKVSCTDQGQVYRFSVADDGPGIEAKFHENIFQMFNRLHTKDEIEGTGLGLAIVKRVVSACGGKVWVKSEVGHGTTFYFTWPKFI